MNKRFFIIAITAAMLSPLSAFAQAPRAERTDAAGARNWTAPRTPWGEPDLQGTYSNRTITPFERPANVAGREFFTPEEVAALEKRAQEQSGDEGRIERDARRRRARLQRLLVGPWHQGHDATHLARDRSA